MGMNVINIYDFNHDGHYIKYFFFLSMKVNIDGNSMFLSLTLMVLPLGPVFINYLY